jgi:hypothetical protein
MWLHLEQAWSHTALFFHFKFGPLTHTLSGHFRSDCVGTFSGILPDLFREIRIATRHHIRQSSAKDAHGYRDRFNRQKQHIAGRDTDADAGFFDGIVGIGYRGEQAG